MIDAALLWLTSPLGTVFLVVFGLALGSFLNVVICRLPIMILRDESQYIQSALHLNPGQPQAFNLVVPRSRCLNCHTTIAWFHNIPLLSWFWLRGRCSTCQSSISIQYPVVEATTALILLFVLMQYGLTLEGAFKLLFFLSLICVVFIDWQHRLVPDSLSIPLIAGGLLASVFVSSSISGVSSTDAIIGATVGYLLFASLNVCYRLLTQKTGIGAGDFRLAAAMGAWFGWIMLPWLLLLAATSALVYGVFLLIRKQYHADEGVQFASFLGLAGIVLICIRDLGLLPNWILS